MGLIVEALLSGRRTHVLTALRGFRGRTGEAWLHTGHPASGGDFASGSWPAVAALPPARLIEATAASAPNHCLDGWSYAARATAALLAGDYHASRHLAYYAQLRAAVSILANLGVGIFNRINFAITEAGTIRRIDDSLPGARQLGLGTHKIAWAALHEWSKDAAGSRAFLDNLRFRGTALRECLEALWPGASSTVVSGSIVTSWGADLKRGESEHSFRNVSSYNPQSLNPLGTSVEESLLLVDNFWTMCEPTGGGSFRELDKYILRSVLQSHHWKLHGNKRYKSGAIDRDYDKLPALVGASVSKDFLLGIESPDDPLMIKLARLKADPAQPTHMVARSYLLLRLATAFTLSSLIDAGLDLAGGDLRPWLNELAARRGFWPPHAPFDDLSDLWTDVELALMDFDQSRQPMPSCWHDWTSQSVLGLPQILEMERVGVWSLSA